MIRSNFRHFPRLGLAVSALCLIAGTVVADTDPSGPPPGQGGDGSRGHRERWESLGEEERTKLKEALRDVWTDPAVLGAREDVRVASEAYREAIRAAIGKADPEVSELLAGLQASIDGKMEGRMGDGPPGGPPGGRSGFRRGGDYPILPPGFVEKLDPQKRESLRKAEAKARESEKVKKSKEKFDEIRRQDDELRELRMDAHRQMRRAIVEEMVESDPSLGPILREAMTPPWSGKGRGRDGGKPRPPMEGDAELSPKGAGGRESTKKGE